MNTVRLLLLFTIVALLALSGICSATAAPGDLIALANGDFEGGFVSVTVGGHAGSVGEGWTPFVVRGSPRFLAGQVQPPLNHWQVIHGPDGPYVAGVLQQVVGTRVGERLRAEAEVYLPVNVDGIAKTIGLDPTGGQDPLSSTVVWSAGGVGSPWQTIAVTATMASTQTTVFVVVAQPEQALRAAVLIDTITLERVGFEQEVFLPVIAITRPSEPPGWQYQVDGIITGALSCTSTGMRGTIRDEAGAPQAGVRVRVWSATASGQPSFVSAPTGSDGDWEIVMDSSRPIAGRWLVAAVNQDLQSISPVVGQVAYSDSLSSPETRGVPTSDDCVNGHQWLVINFQRRSEFPVYTLASVRFLSCQENHLDHNLRLWVITSDGQGLRHVPVRFVEAGGLSIDLLTGSDPFRPAGYVDYPIFSRQSWTAHVLAGLADTSPSMSSETPPVVETCSGNAWGHYSYEIVFQRRP